MYKYATTFLLLFLLAACQSLGLQEAKSLDQRIAYAVGVQTAVNNAAASALSVGSIKKSDAEFVFKSSTDARTLLDAARLANNAGDPATAEGRLTLAVNILTQLQDYLRAHK